MTTRYIKVNSYHNLPIMTYAAPKDEGTDMPEVDVEGETEGEESELKQVGFTSPETKIALELADKIKEGSSIDTQAITFAKAGETVKRSCLPIYDEMVKLYGNQMARFPRPGSKKADNKDNHDLYDDVTKRGDGMGSMLKDFADATPSGQVCMAKLAELSEDTSKDVRVESDKALWSERRRSIQKFYITAIRLHYQLEDVKNNLKSIRADVIRIPQFKKDSEGNSTGELLPVEQWPMSPSTKPIEIGMKGASTIAKAISLGQFIAIDTLKVAKLAKDQYEGNQYKAMNARKKKTDKKQPGQTLAASNTAEGLSIAWGTKANVNQAEMHAAQLALWLDTKENMAEIVGKLSGKLEDKRDLLLTIDDIVGHLLPLVKANQGIITKLKLDAQAADEAGKKEVA